MTSDARLSGPNSGCLPVQPPLTLPAPVIPPNIPSTTPQPPITSHSLHSTTLPSPTSAHPQVSVYSASDSDSKCQVHLGILQRLQIVALDGEAKTITVFDSMGIFCHFYPWFLFTSESTKVSFIFILLNLERLAFQCHSSSLRQMGMETITDGRDGDVKYGI